MSGARLQTRLEQTNLHQISYVGQRMVEIATEYTGHLGGRDPEAWLRDVAIELVRVADRLAGAPVLFPDPHTRPVEDSLVRQIKAAPNRVHLDRIRQGYAQRWTDDHEVLRRERLAELDARW